MAAIVGAAGEARGDGSRRSLLWRAALAALVCCVAAGAEAPAPVTASLGTHSAARSGNDDQGCSPTIDFDPLASTYPGCALLHVDTAADPNAASIWGAISCADPSRVTWFSSGGDTHPTPDGQPQGNDSYRRATVLDGDNFYGERCELGYNEWRFGDSGGAGTFSVYREGTHRVTFESLRLPADFPLSTRSWQVVTQMKQAEPSNNGGGTPVLELDANSGRWELSQSESNGESSNSRTLWSTPATRGVWTRFAWDVYYSQDPAKGYVQLWVETGGAGGSTVRSPVVHTYTLKREIGGSGNRIPAGASIPSHLRVGVYHDPSIPGTSIDIDNVEVMDASETPQQTTGFAVPASVRKTLKSVIAW
jgi:hypothetical protein